MTDVKFDAKVTAAVEDGLAPYVGQMFAQQDGRWVGVVELKHVRREEPGIGEDKAPAVKLRFMHCEVAPPEHEDLFRELLQTTYKLRTAQGTLDDTGDAQVLPASIKWAMDAMLWPPQPGDVWVAGDEPYFAYVDDNGEVALLNYLGATEGYNALLNKHQRMDLKARKRVKKGDDSA